MLYLIQLTENERALLLDAAKIAERLAGDQTHQKILNEVIRRLDSNGTQVLSHTTLLA